MTREPIIPQQLETVQEVVRKTQQPWSKSWTGRELVAGDDGIWHRLANPQRRSASYWTVCVVLIPGREARTALDGDPTCSACLEKTRAQA